MPADMGDFGPFRPLKPYTEADRSLFFGRERELADLAEKLAADRPSVLLAGEPGIGKTSLVRAGLLPSLKSRGVGCGYIDCNQLDENQVPSGGGASGSLMVLDDLGAALDEGPRFDKLLLLLKKAGGVRGLKILFVIDDPDLWRLDALEKLIGSVGGQTARVRLGRLDQARVGDIIERSVLGGGAYFEAGLSHEMAVDVCRRGDISPSELQLVAATSVALHLNTLKAYRRSGGAEAVVWRFFERACSLAGQTSRRAAARVLAELASLDSRGVASRDQLARAAGVDEGSADKLAALLGQEHLVRREGDGYTLASEWSRQLARAYTGEARGRGVAARLLLRRKIEGGGLLSIGDVREVKRYGGTLAADEEGVVKRSVQVGLLVTALILSLPIAGLVLLYGSYGRSYYLDAAPGPGASVVARLGRGGGAMASLPHSPAFGSVIADSGFTRAALKEGVPSGAGPRAGDDWLRRLEAALDPLPHAAVALILDGDVKPLTIAYEDAALRPAVVGAVGAAGKGAPEEIALLKKAQSDPSEDVRRRAVGAGAALERRVPGAGVDLLAAGLKDNSPSVRALALHEVERLPDEQSAPLLASALAQTTDPVVRRNALEAIGAQVARTPPAAAKLGLAMLGPSRGDASAILSRLLDGNGPSADAAAAALAEVALNAKAPEDARIEAIKMLRRRDTTPAGLEAITGSPKLLAALMPLLVRNKPEDAQAKVAEAMKGPVPLRAAAAAAIGLLPKTVDTPKLLKVLQYDANQEVHAEAVRALPVLGREALPLLVKEAKGSGPDVEKAAVETIGVQAVKLGVAAAAQALESIVKGARPSTRRAAIEALGRIAEQKSSLAAGALGRLVRDKVPDVRADAAGALGDVLMHGGKEAISALRSVSKDPDPATRKRAAGALGRAKGPLATPAAKAFIFIGMTTLLILVPLMPSLRSASKPPLRSVRSAPPRATATRSPRWSATRTRACVRPGARRRSRSAAAVRSSTRSSSETSPARRSPTRSRSPPPPEWWEPP